MNPVARHAPLLLASFFLLAPVALPAAPGLLAADVAPATDGSYIFQWQTANPDMRVAIFEGGPDGKLLREDGLARGYTRIYPGESRSGSPRFYVVVDGGPKDPKQDGLWAANRVVPLEQGSNFRDLGGYVTRDGHRVRRGLLYRSGAPVMLTAKDLETIDKLGIRTTVDLRSNEERQMNPSQLAGPGRQLVTMDYSLLSLMPKPTPGQPTGKGAPPQNDGYGASVVLLAPLYHSLFTALLKGDGAVQYNCSAGQDRTGIASALILSALGVPREQILRDYHLSTELRRPQYELGKITREPTGKAMKMLRAIYKKGGGKAEPLYGADGVSTLGATLDMIDRKWGSVAVFLQKEIGLTKSDLQRLKDLYLEQGESKRFP